MTYTLIPLLIPVYALFVGALLWAELTQSPRAQAMFKPLACLGFIVLAFASDALTGPHGWHVLGALIFCALGDVLLLARGRNRLFKAGMAAFATGHLIFAVTFYFIGHDLGVPVTKIVVVTAVMALIALIILRKIPKDMTVPVGIYSVIISLMVLAAMISGQTILMIGAAMFAVSDVFVARDRFIHPSRWNALLITPLYFGAQAVFALSIPLVS